MELIHFYDRNGKPLEVLEWAEKLGDAKYKRVAETTLPNGMWVSTVWIGLDGQFGEGEKIIFETMVFAATTSLTEIDMASYSTEAEAIEGHNMMVNKWKKRKARAQSSGERSDVKDEKVYL